MPELDVFLEAWQLPQKVQVEGREVLAGAVQMQGIKVVLLEERFHLDHDGACVGVQVQLAVVHSFVDLRLVLLVKEESDLPQNVGIKGHCEGISTDNFMDNIAVESWQIHDRLRIVPIV